VIVFSDALLSSTLTNLISFCCYTSNLSNFLTSNLLLPKHYLECKDFWQSHYINPQSFQVPIPCSAAPGTAGLPTNGVVSRRKHYMLSLRRSVLDPLLETLVLPHLLRYCCVAKGKISTFLIHVYENCSALLFPLHQQSHSEHRTNSGSVKLK
jgi:hypothetical protein